jgi:hypothetical protein
MKMKKNILFLVILIISSYGCTKNDAPLNNTNVVNVKTARTLSSLLTTEQKDTITKLTITGTIDARDFVTMRDSMPALAVLDISAVNIAAYNGDDGTYTDTFYPANTVPEYSFSNNKFTSITLPNSVISIGSDAFYYCSGLTSITIPSSVTFIGDSAFSNCNGMTSVTIPSSVTSIGDYAFEDCFGLTSVTIPSSETSIGDYAFWNCFGLTSITIPSSVTSIGQGAFMACSGLTSVTIPSSVTSIGSVAFYYCSGLTSVTIPSSVTSIGELAFYGCSGSLNVDPVNANYSSLNGVLFNKAQTTLLQCTISKTTAIIPSSVTSIGDAAFGGCTALTSIYAYPTTPPVNLNSFSLVFYEVNKNTCVLNVPVGSLNAYKAAYYWNAFTHIIGI